jgi:hypothetical protein
MFKGFNKLESEIKAYSTIVIIISSISIILDVAPFNIDMIFATSSENQTNLHNQNKSSSNGNQCLLTNASLPQCNNLGYPGQVNSGNNTLADGENANIKGGNNFIGQGR